MKIKITKVTYTDTKKDGTKCIDKNSKPFYKVGIQTQEHGDQWINGLVFGEPPTWQAGEEVELDIKEEEYQGTKSLKFDLPTKSSAVNSEIEKLWIFGRGLEIEIKQIKHQLGGEKPVQATPDANTSTPQQDSNSFTDPNAEFQGASTVNN